jgi:hypothetical protein
MLRFDDLKTIDEESAASLKNSKAKILYFTGFETLPVEAAKHLATWPGKKLAFVGLENAPQELIQCFTGFKGQLYPLNLKTASK